ncbi:hypothetical protein OIT44_01975 [Weissella ceti]|uniref:Glyoxylate reductase n=1 Tax=Weissella ceti TaxID=759620 RepID=A0ABT3E340_9LACO|nr:NAD(P)-dependent oxidoreductase [Weissella ceti]MCW0952836.1 hypothetical protein [Weissella ceti]QVK12533.1 hypothetical protein KHQ31_02605 [Weissella ceti]
MYKVVVTTELPKETMHRLTEQSFEVVYALTKDVLEKEIIDTDVIISAVNVELDTELLQRGQKLKFIANIGAGYSNISTEIVKEGNVKVANTPTHDAIQSTAELTVLLLLAVVRQLKASEQIVEQNNFEGWRVTGYLGGHQVSGKTATIIGFGRIGQTVGRLLAAFDVEVQYVDPIPAKETHAKRVDLNTGLQTADFVILNASLNEDNHHMIDADQFKLMQKHAYLVNAGRGPLIHETALVDALDKQEIAGAALDVHEFEPEFTVALENRSNVVLTPHIGNDTYEARLEMANSALNQVIHFIEGEYTSIDFV